MQKIILFFISLLFSFFVCKPNVGHNSNVQIIDDNEEYVDLMEQGFLMEIERQPEPIIKPIFPRLKFLMFGIAMCASVGLTCQYFLTAKNNSDWHENCDQLLECTCKFINECVCGNLGAFTP